jgi:hypothetical protein
MRSLIHSKTLSTQSEILEKEGGQSATTNMYETSESLSYISSLYVVLHKGMFLFELQPAHYPPTKCTSTMTVRESCDLVPSTVVGSVQ